MPGCVPFASFLVSHYYVFVRRYLPGLPAGHGVEEELPCGTAPMFSGYSDLLQATCLLVLFGPLVIDPECSNGGAKIGPGPLCAYIYLCS